MQVAKPPVHKGVHNVHTSLAGQIRDERTLPGSKKAAISGKSSKKIRFGHVVTTTRRHE